MFRREPDGATPVDADEAADLLPSHIRTREELNLWEQQNILEAAKWARRARTPALTLRAVREVHRRMFDKTWAWAGKYRQSDKNIGVHWPTIGTEVHKLLEDGSFWMDEVTFPVDEAAMRLHHRMVKIHPFPNGNGRHGRLWCDLFLRQAGRPPFEWKSRELDTAGEARAAYIAALRAADGNDLEPLRALLLVDR